MNSLFLTDRQMLILNQLIVELEEKFGKYYTYQYEEDEFSCKCSGPAQSCIWH